MRLKSVRSAVGFYAEIVGGRQIGQLILDIRDWTAANCDVRNAVPWRKSLAAVGFAVIYDITGAIAWAINVLSAAILKFIDKCLRLVPFVVNRNRYLVVMRSISIGYGMRISHMCVEIVAVSQMRKSGKFAVGVAARPMCLCPQRSGHIGSTATAPESLIYALIAGR